MDWFAVEIENIKCGSEGYRIFRLYDIRSGDVFFHLEVDFNNKNPYHNQTTQEYESVVEQLKELALTMKENEPYSYDKYIKPIFRENKLKELGI
jgi:hypothetical protein